MRAGVSWVSWGSLTPLSHSHKTRWKEREAYHRRNCRKYACNTAWDSGHVQSLGLPYKSGLCIAHSHVERRSSGTTIEILINIWRWVSSSCAIDNGNISSSSSNKVWHVRVPQSRFCWNNKMSKLAPRFPRGHYLLRHAPITFQKLNPKGSIFYLSFPP